MKQQKLLVNQKIRSNVVFLIDDSGDQQGRTDVREAQRRASEKGLDLVQVGFRDDQKLPVCKIMDYGKMRYEESKRRHHRKKNHANDLKQVMFRPRISGHDLDIKKRKVEELIGKSHKVKFGIELRGRERAYRRDAREMLETHLHDFDSIAKHDAIRENDRSVYVTLNPLS